MSEYYKGMVKAVKNGDKSAEEELLTTLNYIEQLQQEKQKLKERYSIRTKAYNNILLENADLKDRINKASSLLKEFYETGNIPLNNISKAYFELNGGSNESQR